MNRENRRKHGLPKMSKEDILNTPCTLTEVVQVSRGVVQDEIDNYVRRTSPVQVSLSIQVEILKSIVIGSGLITEEEFKKLYMEKAEDFNRRQKEMLEKVEESKVATEMASDSVSIDISRE